MLAANSNFLVPDGTFIAELIAFLIILGIIAKWILPPLNKAMQARQEEIRSSLEAADEAKTEADETRAQRQGIIDEARQQAREIVAQANRAADQVRADGQARGQQEYERLVASADAEIALARQRALDEITSRIGALVLSVARQVIEREIDAQQTVRARPTAGPSPEAPDCEPCDGDPPPGGFMLTFLRGYSVAVLQNAASAASPASASAGSAAMGVEGVARDLREVADMMSSTASLVQVMTDEMVPAIARRAVANELLASRIVPPALRIVERAIGTERADSLLPALSELAELAIVFWELGPDEFEAQEPLLGRVASRHAASGYATAVLDDVRSVAELEVIEGQLFAFAGAVESNDLLRAALADSSRPLSDRRRLISDLLAGRADPVTVRLARAALHQRSRDPAGSLEWMAERVAEARGWRVARVTTARSIDETERNALGNALEALTQTPVELFVTEDPRLLGGAVIAVGNLLVDATAQHRLDQLYEELLGSDYVAMNTN
jgi:F-type H+-transporting ATPase subunit b